MLRPRRLATTLVVLASMHAPAFAQPPRTTPAERRADVAQLRDLMLNVEKSWTPATRALAVAQLGVQQRGELVQVTSVAACEQLLEE